MNVILFGPPGIGKSTIIGHLKTLGKRALDLEDLYPNRIRFQVPNLVDDVYIGAADLAPQRKYRNAIKVLLWIPQADYDARRAARDKTQPGKAVQQHHSIDDWKSAKYDLLVRVDGDPIQATRTLISQVDSLAKKKGGNAK